MALVGEIIFAVLVVTFIGWLARPVVRNLWTGKYPGDQSGGTGLMPPSGPDISGGIGGL